MSATSEIEAQVQVHETTMVATESVVIGTSSTTTTTTTTETESTVAATNGTAAVETMTVSKRTAKKMKKALYAAQDAGVREDEQDNANNMATIDHPYLSFLHKRIRSYKKKLEKIKSLETARSEEGKVLNVQQLELVGTKFAMEKLVSEFESLREQFIEVYLQEEATKKAEQEQRIAAAAAAAQVSEVAASEPAEEEVAAPVDTKTEEANAIDTTQDAFVYVQDLLKTLHVVNLHQALGKEIPMVLDYFSKVLLGNTRPVAEISFADNLEESLDEAKKYLQRSDKVAACDMTYKDLREIVDKLSQLDVLAEVVAPQEEAPVAEELPQINFFTDSLLEEELEEVADEVYVEVTDDKEEEVHAEALELIEEPAVEQFNFVEETSTEVVVETVVVSAPVAPPPMSFAAAAASTPVNAPTTIQSAWNREQPQSAPATAEEKNNQRRRPQGNRWKNNNQSNNSSSNDDSNEGTKKEGDKSRRSRYPRNDENSGARSNYRGGAKDDRRPRVDRGFRKQGSSLHQPQHAHASPQA
uniref:Uncharacterized protein n=1 Tax=Globisporangium ultimum (strain ATCC 200006 / CBS 805.95 / DAOM BR144) TaxID=431595 RepID=K3X1N0_GLOUD